MTPPGHPVWLVRHGETEWNAAGRLQGQGDSPLTATGRAQAEAAAIFLARTLAGHQGLSLVASPLPRTMATARPIARALGLPIEEDRRLMEIGLGAFEGLTWDEVALAHGQAIAGTDKGGRYFRAPGGESHAAMLERLGAWLAAVDRPTVAVSHGMAGRVLRGLYLGLDPVEALILPAPQDGAHLLHGGTVSFHSYAVAPVPTTLPPVSETAPAVRPPA